MAMLHVKIDILLLHRDNMTITHSKKKTKDS